MLKFTPGPWEVWTDHLTVVAGPTKENTPGCIRGIRAEICDCTADEISEDEATANAFLIAAAPDLYEVCTVLIEAYNAHEDQYARQVLRRHVEFAKAALAKANGEVQS